ncbi:hypothetical protein BH11PSE2_BH11PSE2_02530 [soil metagenome]
MFTRRSLAIGLAAASAFASAGAWAAEKGPRLKISKLDQLPTPLPKPYDKKATPAQVNAAVDAGFARAKASGKRVILDLGGNWCSWCRMLSATMALPEAKPFIDAHFVIVPVPVSSAKGKTDRNLQVLKRFGAEKADGFPWLIVAEPTGKVLHSSYEVTDDKHQTPQLMIDWLSRWAKTVPAGSA